MAAGFSVFGKCNCEEKVKALESRLAALEATSETQLRQLVCEAMVAALDGKRPQNERIWGTFDWQRVGNSLTRRIEKRSESQAKETAKKVAADVVEAESFIDEIIDRIKRKQL